jgi:hypothetical protein
MIVNQVVMKLIVAVFQILLIIIVSKITIISMLTKMYYIRE